MRLQTISTGTVNKLLAGALYLLSTSVFAATEVVYYHHDLLGSPIATTDEAGDILWVEDYTPYGSKLSDDMAAVIENVGYTGHRYDSDTGLVYAGARMYDPSLGRFMGIDPVGALAAIDNPVMFNRYAYGNNNPYRYVDPNGKTPVMSQGQYQALANIAKMENAKSNINVQILLTGETNKRILESSKYGLGAVSKAADAYDTYGKWTRSNFYGATIGRAIDGLGRLAGTTADYISSVHDDWVELEKEIHKDYKKKEDIAKKIGTYEGYEIDKKQRELNALKKRLKSVTRGN